MKSNKGFTLLEFLIIFAIIVLLIAIAMPGLVRMRRASDETRANEVKAIETLRAIVFAQGLFTANCGDGYYAPTLASLGVAPEGKEKGFFPIEQLKGKDALDIPGYHIVMSSSSGVAEKSPASCNGLTAGKMTDGFHVIATPTSRSGGRMFGANISSLYYWEVGASGVMTDTEVPKGARPYIVP